MRVLARSLLLVILWAVSIVGYVMSRSSSRRLGRAAERIPEMEVQSLTLGQRQLVICHIRRRLGPWLERSHVWGSGYGRLGFLMLLPIGACTTRHTYS
ncbi:hypothetical protein BDV29DRAFT_185750 [Aspergillus leporis]|uniref:Secreted protein n=1 Tax=Aspergillus leporis TaxID=41062 RepID=A0A5N5WH19_9EURO|nr:hypothetical protein BDV29DRAFT_185750 [Aspergillus leporis]